MLSVNGYLFYQVLTEKQKELQEQYADESIAIPKPESWYVY